MQSNMPVGKNLVLPLLTLRENQPKPKNKAILKPIYSMGKSIALPPHKERKDRRRKTSPQQKPVLVVQIMFPKNNSIQLLTVNR
jgi:hypothetical protein